MSIFIPLHLPDATIFYCSNFLSTVESQALFQKLITTTAWQQDTITLFGKTHLQPRLTAWYAQNGQKYIYSGICMDAKPFPSYLVPTLKRVINCCNTSFNSVLLNLYRDGNDSNGWHSDDEPELGKAPIIASLSLGVARDFKLKHKYLPQEKHTLLLEPGSLLLMGAPTQQFWKHQLPKRKRCTEPRINLTFRTVLKHI